MNFVTSSVETGFDITFSQVDNGDINHEEWRDGQLEATVMLSMLAENMDVRSCA